MASWSKQRRFTYAAAVGILLVGGLAVVAYIFFYEAPTCFDGVLNGSEQDVDCGGACARLCASAFLPPSVAWTRFEQVAPGQYNVAAYIINPNADGEARQVPYHVMLFDDRGILIIDRPGTVTIPPQRPTLAFTRQLDVGKRIPARALFEFTGSPDWRSGDSRLSSLVIGEKRYTEDETGSSLLVSIQNSSNTKPTGRFSVYTVLYDTEGNAIGFAKTVMDDIAPGGSAVAPFTWPFSRDGKVISIEVLPVAE